MLWELSLLLLPGSARLEPPCCLALVHAPPVRQSHGQCNIKLAVAQACQHGAVPAPAAELPGNSAVQRPGTAASEQVLLVHSSGSGLFSRCPWTADKVLGAFV